MPTKLPYVSQPSAIAKVLDKIKEAKTPDRFTSDFLTTVLGCKGGNYKQFAPLAKKMGFLNTDGSPTDLYKSYRNPTYTKGAVAEGIKNAYSELFERNEYVSNLSSAELKGLVVEITGKEDKDNVVRLICSTFETLKERADFEDRPIADTEISEENPQKASDSEVLRLREDDVDLRLSYSINLVLPKTDDPAVFNAIFRSLRENLLRK
ncbi:DUF5343 domain-containing protein [Coraliomargarita sp. W4R53]